MIIKPEWSGSRMKGKGGARPPPPPPPPLFSRNRNLPGIFSWKFVFVSFSKVSRTFLAPDTPIVLLGTQAVKRRTSKN